MIALESRNQLINARIVSEDTNPEVYHAQTAKRGETSFVMTRGELLEFNRCPRRWLLGYESKDTDASDWGSLIDIMALSAHRMEEAIAVCPETYPDTKSGELKPWIFQANYCKRWKESNNGKQIVKKETFAQAENATRFLLGDDQIRDLIYSSRKQVMVCAEYRDEKTGIIVPLKCLIDLVPSVSGPYGKSLADLKTCVSASLFSWTRNVNERGLHWQAALYLDAYIAATGEDRVDFLHVLQESMPPWQVGKRILSAEFLELGRMKYQKALRNYAQCLESARFPGYEESASTVIDGWALTEPEAWMLQS